MFKRVFDIVISSMALVASFPVMLLTALLIRIVLGAPVIFVQARPGRDGHIFELCKFRTMRNAYDKDGNPLADHERMSAFGNLLRKFSLDELPQLWNVLKGDMSLVGPRPLLIDYLELYTPEQARRHEVRPGITGLAQVNGRNGLSFDERFKLDVWYVDHYSPAVDIQIMGKTVLKLLRPQGINQPGHSIGGDPFMGTAAPKANDNAKALDEAA